VRIRRKWRSLTIRILSSSSRRRVFDPSFADRVRSRRSGWTGEDAGALRSEDRVERLGEPGVLIAEQELHGGDMVTEVYQQVASGLGVHAPVGCALTPIRCARSEPCSTAIRA
jgi:hypothetical protein